MSLILEALKKSEQQRRLGEAPTLGSPVVATRRRRNVLPVLVALIVIAGGAAWWLMRPVPQAPAPAAPTAANPPAAAPAKPAAPAHRAAAATAPAQPKPTASHSTPLGDKPAAAATQNAPGKSFGPPAAGKSPLATPLPGMAPGARKPVEAKPAQKPVDAKGSDTATAVAQKPDAAAKPASGSKTDAAVATTTPVPAPAPARPATQAPAIPTIWDLPYATRKDLPAIELTMHVYSSDPAERFVVIKGERHAQGDEIGSDLKLDEIRPDGLVLEFKGQQFLYPRNGR